MGSPARRLINPITRCRDQPHYRYAGTDDGRGTDPGLDTERLTLMSEHPIKESRGQAHDRWQPDGSITRRKSAQSGPCSWQATSIGGMSPCMRRLGALIAAAILRASVAAARSEGSA